MKVDPDLANGARNLLINCAGLKEGSTLLILRENPSLGWYDLEAPLAVASEAQKMNVHPTVLEVGAPGNLPDPSVDEEIGNHDCIIFFARLGDQERFTDTMPGKTSVMCYARNAEMLASTYGQTDHRALVDLKNAVNDILLGPDKIDISCPMGTAFSGRLTKEETSTDVFIHRFPLGVTQPIPADNYSGRVVLTRYLTPTGSKVYEPAFLKLDSPVFAEVELGRVVAFTGEPSVVRQVHEHYRMVADKFSIESDVVHSWHAGIHPGCKYTADAAENPDRWSNTTFTNPRFLHLHTCGNYAPGEICWMVLDPTVSIGAKILWEKGRLRTDTFSGLRRCLESWPELEVLFTEPSDLIGLPGEQF